MFFSENSLLVDLISPVTVSLTSTSRLLGKKNYEISNHLGNVLTVVSDVIIPEDSDTDGEVDGYYADVVSATDYSAFGAALYGRTWSGSDYRYGFNGMEKDDEVKGSGDHLDFGARVYDPRLGRFLSVDPDFKKYTWQTPYCFAANNPIGFIDYQGRGPEKPISVGEIKDKFNDGKKASGYGFILYVDQPEAGTRSNKSGMDDVGHTFIQIVKFNEDGTSTAAVFGFYPEDMASPYNPEAPGAFGDNSGSDYDVSVTKGITEAQFGEILKLAEDFEKGDYDLCSKNCTDFGLQASEKAGIKLPDTQGTWQAPNWVPQSGSTPANLGQDIIEQKEEIEKSQKVKVVVSPKDDILQAKEYTNSTPKK